MTTMCYIVVFKVGYIDEEVSIFNRTNYIFVVGGVGEGGEDG